MAWFTAQELSRVTIENACLSEPLPAPVCPCGSHRWTPFGGMFSPEVSEQNWICDQCKRMAFSIVSWGSGGHIFFVERGPARYEYSFSQCIAEGSPDFDLENRYVNDILFAFWRDLKAREDTRDPIPPRLPDGTIAFIRTRGSWYRIHPRLTKQLPVPIDPIRLRHDNRFAQIFTRVSQEIDENFGLKTIQNQYHKDPSNLEPWYEWIRDGVKIVVGPRKHVISIHASNPGGKLELQRLEAIAKRDKVTFERKEDSVTIHAWTDDTAVEYLVVLVRGL